MTLPDPSRPGLRRLALIAIGLLMAGCASVLPPTEPPPSAAATAVDPTPATSTLPPLASPQTPSPAATETADPPAQPVTRMRLDPEQDSSRVDLWMRVRAGFSLPDLDNDLVRKWEQYYAQRPDYVQRMTARGSRYLFHIVEEINRRDMPTDLALLPFIESAFNPEAISAARAAGMWQFMPGTGRDFELKQNLFRDDRRDVLASTRAALDYLQRLHAQFNDWHLALAAYNWGQGNVQKALMRAARGDQDADYQSLRMPDETRNYVPKLQAIKNIIARPADFGLVLPPLDNHPYFITVAIERDIDVAVAARLSGLSLEQFEQLNPQLNKPVILAAATPQVLLPYDNANRFLATLARHKGPLASWTAWVAPRTLKPADAARQVGMTEGELREVNRIPMRMLVKVGSTLLVPRSAQHVKDVAEHVADNATITLAPEALPPRRLVVKVGKRGESVASLARRHGMTAVLLAATNKVPVSAHFRAGQLVTVLLPPTRKVGPVRSKAPVAAGKLRHSRPAARTRTKRH
ncbi:MAG: transglycosylase SLT domain-containing protein [Rubrivivax sp.]|nr:transglycosylase SLT domain-containing protein [Rubrivivax sp.]